MDTFALSTMNRSLVDDIDARHPDGLAEIRNNPARYPRIKDLEWEDAYAQLHIIVAKAFVYRGQELVRKQVDLIASALLKELLEDFDRLETDHLTTQEIAYAVRQAVLGDAEMYGVTVASLYKAVVRYIKNEGRFLQGKNIARVSGSALETMMQAASVEMLKNHKL